MKAIALFLFLGLCCTNDVLAQIPATAAKNKTLPVEVIPPPVIGDKFKLEYPGLTAVWSMDGKNFRADFMDPNTIKGSSIVYDKDGNVLRRENELENSSYPQIIADYFIKNYPGEKFKTWASIDEKGNKSFFIKRYNDLVWFDKNGKYIEAAK